jgi:heme/copper-type cytochrome/quinol oxidase subunit 3
MIQKVDVFSEATPEVKLRTKKMMMWLIIFAVIMLFAGITSALMVLKGKIMWMHVKVSGWFWWSLVWVTLSSIPMFLAVKQLKSGKIKSSMLMLLMTFVLGICFTFTQNSGWNELSAKGMGGRLKNQNKEVINSEEYGFLDIFWNLILGRAAYDWNPLGKFTGAYGEDYWIESKGKALVQWNGEFFDADDVNHEKPKTAQIMSTFNASGALISVLIYLHIIHLVFGLGYLLININRLRIGKLNQENYMSLHANGMYWHFMGILWAYLFVFVFFIY